jgi:anti-sigma B factor antagonist
MSSSPWPSCSARRIRGASPPVPPTPIEHSRRIAQHRHEHVRTFGGRSWILKHLGAVLRDRTRSLGRAVPGANLEAAADQIASHWQPHRPCTQECNGRHTQLIPKAAPVKPLPRQEGGEISTLAPTLQSHFRVDVRADGPAGVIAVSGELDLASSAELELELTRMIDSGSELIVLDLRDLEFMDSTGLSTLVKAHQQAAGAGKRFGVVRGPQQVQRLLSLTGVDERMTFADTPEELLSGG